MMVRPPLSGSLLSIYNEAAEFLAARQPVRAAERFQAAVPVARGQGSVLLVPWFLSRAGQALFNAREWNRADAVYEQAIQEAATADPITKGELLRQRAAGFAYRDDLANAAKYHSALLVEWRKLKPESMVVANSLLLLANIDLRRFELDEAETHLQQAFAIVEKLAPTSAQMVSILDDFGDLFEEQVNFVKAHEYYRQALIIDERYRPSSRQVANILTNLGTMAHQQGNLGRAEAYHRRALAIAEKMERSELQVANILSNLGECVIQGGDRANAEKYQKRALLLRQQVAPNTLSTAASLASLGKITRINGDLPKAEEYYHEASAMATKVDAPT